MKKKIAIIGAGPAGLTAAYMLCKNGFDVSLFEASNEVGGMAKTIKLWDQLVDLGPHRFFSNNRRVNTLWLEMTGTQYSMVNRLTRIYYKDTFFNYPLKAFNALFGLGLFQSIICVFSYLKVKIFPLKNDNTFDLWVINRFGKKLYNIFFKSYSEKLWGIPCSQLDADFATQRIKKLSLYEAIKASLLGSKGTEHKTLVDEFAYPHMGAGVVYETMLTKIKKMGGKVFLNTLVYSVQPALDNNLTKITLSSKKTIKFDHIVSTMPISLLVKQMGAPKYICDHASKLKFRNTILVYLQIKNNNLFPDQWIYIHASNLKMGRITNFKNWVPSINKKNKKTILCLEYWCYEKDSLWTSKDEDLISLARNEIYKTKLVPTNSVIKGHVVRVPKCYPVYEKKYKTHLLPIENFLSSKKNLSVIGRYGAFKYNNQDHSILMGILAAENISNNTNHNLWEINTDYEYQESSRITSTGLKKE